MRHYSRGKHVLESLGGKTLVMTLLSHEDPNVRYGRYLSNNVLLYGCGTYLSPKWIWYVQPELVKCSRSAFCFWDSLKGQGHEIRIA